MSDAECLLAGLWRKAGGRDGAYLVLPTNEWMLGNILKSSGRGW
jgi:hypothetical protein